MDDRTADDNPFAGLSRYPPEPDEFDEPDWFDSTGDLLYQNWLNVGLGFGFLASSVTLVASLPMFFGPFGWLCFALLVAICLAILLIGHSLWRR